MSSCSRPNGEAHRQRGDQEDQRGRSGNTETTSFCSGVRYSRRGGPCAAATAEQALLRLGADGSSKIMDPTANLTEVLLLAEEILTIDKQEWKDDPETVAIVADNGVRLAELVRTLDEWIQSGGFLPTQWKKKR